MFGDFQDLSFQLHNHLRDAGFSLRRGQVQQLLAALLGYNSLAALQASQEEQPGIAGADHVVANAALLTQRSLELGTSEDEAHTLCDLTIAGLELIGQRQLEVHTSEDEFVESVLIPFVERDVTNDGAVSSEMAMTNAYVNHIYVEADNPERLAGGGSDTWSVGIAGTVYMDSDPEKPFWGDRVRFEGDVSYWRVGRMCLAGKGRLELAAKKGSAYEEDYEQV